MKRALKVIVLLVICFSCNTEANYQKEPPTFVMVLHDSPDLKEQEKKLLKLKGFRNYELGSHISKFPNLIPLPNEDILLDQGIIETKCFFDPNEDLNFADLEANKIRHYFYKDRLFTTVIGISKFSSLKFTSTINKMFNANYQPDVNQDKYNSDTIDRFINNDIELTIEPGTDHDFIYYKSTKIEEEMDADVKAYNKALEKERENKF